MAVFLVNQGKTYRHELAGGYIWSPKFNKAGGQNKGYNLMKTVQKGDYLFHNAGGKIAAISVVKEDCKSGSQPDELKTGNTRGIWDDDGWIIYTDYYELTIPILTSSLVDWMAKNYKANSAFQKNGKLKLQYLCSLDDLHTAFIVKAILKKEKEENVKKVLLDARRSIDMDNENEKPIRIKWDKYEAALLVDGYMKTKHDPARQEKVIADISRVLRNYYSKNGLRIDEQFRNITGISMQMKTVEYIDSEGANGLSNGSILFKEIVNLYYEDKAGFAQILEEAIRRFSYKKDMPFFEYTSDNEFYSWLKNNGYDNEIARQYSEALSTLEIYADKCSLPARKLYNASKLGEIQSTIKAIMQSDFIEDINGNHDNIYYYALEQYVKYVTLFSAEDPADKDTAVTSICKESSNSERINKEEKKQRTKSDNDNDNTRNEHSINTKYKTTKKGAEDSFEYVRQQYQEEGTYIIDYSRDTDVADFVEQEKELESTAKKGSILDEGSVASDESFKTSELPNEICDSESITSGKGEAKKRADEEKIVEKNDPVKRDHKNDSQAEKLEMLGSTFDELHFWNGESVDDEDIDWSMFSTRTRRMLTTLKCQTVGDILRLTDKKILSVSGVGKRTVQEIDDFIIELKGRYRSAITLPVIEKQMDNSERLVLFKEYIRKREYSSLDKLNLSDDEKRYIERIKEAREVFDPDLENACFENTDYIIILRNVFSSFHKENKVDYEYRRKINILEHNIPKERLSLRVEGLIKAYGRNEQTVKFLMEGVRENESLAEFLLRARFDDNEFKRKEIIKFVKWLPFDIIGAVEGIWKKTINNNETTKTVIQMRAEKNTLETVGNQLGVTRERVRQIENKAIRVFLNNLQTENLMMKIYALRNQDTVLTSEELSEYFGKNTVAFLYLLRKACGIISTSFSYDSYLDVFIIGDTNMTERVQQFVDDLPSRFDKRIKSEIIEAGISEYGLNQEIIEEALKEEYQISGKIYHKTRLTVKEVYENILEKYYPNGIYIYDDKEIQGFKEKIRKEYGNIVLPESDRTIGVAISRNAVLRDRGTYAKKKDKYLSKSLKKSIEKYIRKSKSNVIMYSSIFVEFQEELAQEGIDNRYYLQGVLKHYFDDVFVFKKDWICKNQNATNITDEIIRLIKKSESPVLKDEIKKAFPGVSEIVINTAASNEKVLNYFGAYFHASHIQLMNAEKQMMRKSLADMVSKQGYAHIKDIYSFFSKEYDLVLARNGVNGPYSLFSFLEYFFETKFTFERPYVAKRGIEIDKPEERLRGFIAGNDVISISEIASYANDIHYSIGNLLEYLDTLNDDYLLIDDENIASFDYIGIDTKIAKEIVKIIETKTDKSIFIRDVDFVSSLPKLNTPWNEWLIYSIIKKWSSKLQVGVSNPQFRYAIPIIAKKNKLEIIERNREREDHGWLTVADNLNDMDDLVADILEEMEFDDI